MVPESGLKHHTPVLNVCRSHTLAVYTRARPPGTRVFMYSNPRAHRVGRLLAFLIEPFILALAYAHTLAYAICRDSSKSVAYTHASISIIVISRFRIPPFELRFTLAIAGR